MTMLSFSSDNPGRPPQWRWQRARAIVEGRGLPTTMHRDGPDGHMWITRAIRFIDQYDAAGSENERQLIAEENPGIFWAYWIWHANQDIKFSIEAHLLTGETDLEISTRFGTSRAVVEAYAGLFFNVRERLQEKQYIINSVLLPAKERSADTHHDYTWKLYAYFSGVHILDALESNFVNPIKCASPESVGAAFVDDAINTLKMKASMATKSIRVNTHTQLPIMDQFSKFIEIERTTDAIAGGNEQILGHVGALQVTNPISVGQQMGPPGIPQSRLDEFEECPIELTYEEIMQLAADRKLANEDSMRALSFPVTESTQIIDEP